MTRQGAGCLIAKVEKDGSFLFLGLIAPIEKRMKSGGVYDLPKGSMKSGESSLECAKRECFEECGISIVESDIIGYPVSSENLTIYPALTNQKVTILPNPDSGIIEHEGYKWCVPTELVRNSLPWLRPTILKCLARFYKN